MQSYVDELLNYIEQQPDAAFWLVCMVAFLESMAFVGVLVPGWLILVGVGSLIGHSILPFYPMCLAMFIGAVIGEGASYSLGYYNRRSIRHWRFIASHQTLLERADQLVERYGIFSLVVGRFIGPLRAIVPMVTGIGGMKPPLFWFVNFSSAVLWAPLFLLPGILLGAALTLPDGSKETMAVFVFSEIIFLWLARKWWRESQIEKDNSMLRVRAWLALSCSLMLFVIFLSSSIGSEVLIVLGQVLKLVG